MGNRRLDQAPSATHGKCARRSDQASSATHGKCARRSDQASSANCGRLATGHRSCKAAARPTFAREAWSVAPLARVRLRRSAPLVLATFLLTTPGAAQPSPPGPLPPGAEARSLLGQPLVPPALAPAIREAYEQRLAEARRAHERTPDNTDSIIWLGRRTAYLGRYREAIAIFGDGIRKHPTDARMYRHRGHRWITVRELDRAIADLARADSLTRGRPDEVEPDGIPNARGIPTSTLQSNIRYHLGLAHYLLGHFDAAAAIYGRDVAAARETANADMLVASSHWLYMALRRSGREREAAAVLQPIRSDLPVIENGSYHRLLLMYKGELAADSVLPRQPGGEPDFGGVEGVTVGYGVANWHFYHGRTEQAMALFRKILESPQWAAFGFIAAESEVARKREQ